MKITRKILALILTSVLFFGSFPNISVKASSNNLIPPDTPTIDSGGNDDFVSGEVLAPADSLEHAQEIAAAYKLKLKSYAYGIAVLAASNPEQTVNQSQMAFRSRSVRIPDLSLNYLYTIYDDPETTDTVLGLNSRIGEIEAESDLQRTEPSYIKKNSAQWHHAIIENESANEGDVLPLETSAFIDEDPYYRASLVP